MQLSNISLAITRLSVRSSSGPTLDLDFTSGTLDSRVTFVRASNATRVNSAGFIELMEGNIPRFGYNPSTLAAQGLLIEEQRTNLFFQSEDFTTGSWAKTNVTITANTAISPSGVMNASTLTGNSVNNEHRVFQNITVSTAVAFSVFAKKGTNDFLQLRTNNVASGYANFDLNLGTTSAFAGATSSIEIYKDGWYKCVMLSPAAAVTNLSYNLVTSLSAGRGQQVVLTTSVYIWGAQLEQDSFASSYMPTAASQVTRAADVVTMMKTNFSNWYRQDEGSLYAEVVYNGQLTGSSLETNSIFIDDGSADNRYSIRTMRDTSAAQADVSVVSGTVSQMDTAGATPISTGVIYKRALAYALNNAIPCVNGVLDGTTDTSFTLPVAVNRLTVDSTNCALYLRRLSFYPRRLNNSELQSITT